MVFYPDYNGSWISNSESLFKMVNLPAVRIIIVLFLELTLTAWSQGTAPSDSVNSSSLSLWGHSWDVHTFFDNFTPPPFLTELVYWNSTKLKYLLTPESVRTSYVNGTLNGVTCCGILAYAITGCDCIVETAVLTLIKEAESNRHTNSVKRCRHRSRQGCFQIGCPHRRGGHGKADVVREVAWIL